MAKFLITGCNGQVGHCLVQQLKNQADVLAVDIEQLDITDESAVEVMVKEFRPDVIINAAAHTAVDKAETEISLSEAININGPKFLATAAQKIGALMLHISTDYVFDGQTPGEYQETDPVDPQGVYGRTKLAGEYAVQEACERSIILRTAWVFGEHGNNFVKTMIRLGKERDSLGIVSDQFGGPTYAGDIATALIKIAHLILAGKSDAFGVYHFTGKPYVSWFEFAQAIFAQAQIAGIINKQPLLNPISTHDYPTPAKRPANSRLSLNKIQTAFDIQPSNWQKALENIKAYQA